MSDYYFWIVLFFAVCHGKEQPRIEDPANICVTRNGYYKVDGRCDAYIECLDYRPSRQVCPDGLNFNRKAEWPAYPCDYPTDAPCVGRDASQPPKPNSECPRQYGFFPSPLAAANDCGQYRLCADGHAYDMFCPFGLAFDYVKARCDWPDHVPGCSSTEYIGFKCPPPQYDMNGMPVISNYRYENDCYMFYSCQSGRARLLSCDQGYAFDSNVGLCVSADQSNCLVELSIEDTDSGIESE